MPKASKTKKKLPKSPKNVFSKGKKVMAKAAKADAESVDDGKSKPNFPQQLIATKHSYVKPMLRKPAK